MRGVEPNPGSRAPAQSVPENLHSLARQFEAILYLQMLQSMRGSDWAGKEYGAGGNDSLYGGIFEEHLASLAAARLDGALGTALARQLGESMEATDRRSAEQEERS